MSRPHNETVPLLLTLLVTVGLLLTGGWLLRDRFLSSFGQFSGAESSQAESTSETSDSTSTSQTTDRSETAAPLQLDTSLPNPSTITIDGSVTMVALMKQLQLSYTRVQPDLPTTYGVPDGKPNGTNAGLQNLIDGQVWLAASSRPLNAGERTAGLQSIAIGRDALAIAVGANNPFTGSLTLEQLKQIFQGQITNWSQVGGPDRPIRVINRSPNSGTYSLFQDIVLLGGSFAPNGQNFTTATQDETTALLQALGSDGITYSSIQQVTNQQTVRIVPIDGVSPSDREAVRQNQYPISRVIYLVVKQPTSPGVKQFIEMTLSPQGQQIIERVGFIPL